MGFQSYAPLLRPVSNLIPPSDFLAPGKITKHRNLRDLKLAGKALVLSHTFPRIEATIMRPRVPPYGRLGRKYMCHGTAFNVYNAPLRTFGVCSTSPRCLII